uniref:Uncharacterized protein n=1 Tax=Globodera rostochiensis TaxID=31243 RepID=A0A914I045_GLORO
MRTTKKRVRDQGQHQTNKQHLQGEIFELQKLDRQIIFALMLDIDSLARKFLAEQYDHSLNRFAEIFMEMELSSIFLGRFSSSDLVEFSEVLFIYCSRFMFAPLSNSSNFVGKGELSNLQSDGIVSSRDFNRNYKERIFGLFLCYSLYFLQPSQYVIPISVTASQLDGFYEFLGTVLMPEEHFEAIYCFYRLVDSNAFSVVPLEGNFNPLLQRSLNFFLHNKSSPEVCEVDATDEFGLLFSLSNSDVLKQSESLHRHYISMKAQCNVELPRGAQILNESPMDIVRRLLKETEEIYSQQCTLEEEGSKGVISRRNQIRENAYAQSGKHCLAILSTMG